MIKTTVIPAYGRDYKSAKDTEKDFRDGKDFVIADISNRWDGKYCSIRDFAVGDQIKIRYKGLRNVTIVTV